MSHNVIFFLGKRYIQQQSDHYKTLKTSMLRNYYVNSIVYIIRTRLVELCVYAVVCVFLTLMVANSSSNNNMVYLTIGLGIALPIIIIGWVAYVDAKHDLQSDKDDALYREKQRVKQARDAILYNYTTIKEDGDCDVANFQEHAAFECKDGKVARKKEFIGYADRCLPGNQNNFEHHRAMTCNKEGQYVKGEWQ